MIRRHVHAASWGPVRDGAAAIDATVTVVLDTDDPTMPRVTALFHGRLALESQGSTVRIALHDALVQSLLDSVRDVSGLRPDPSGAVVLGDAIWSVLEDLAPVATPTLAPRWESRAAMELLETRLGLVNWDSQDWDIVLADGTRLEEFCDLYESANLDSEVRFALMRLIVASLDERLANSQEKTDVARVEAALQQEFALHGHTVRYWALLEETDPENVFAVTPMMRRVWTQGLVPLVVLAT